MLPSLRKYNDREDGFTLIELLIVVLIIGILAAIAIPVYLGIQAQGYKSAVRGDVNLSVKRVQVAVTEGKAISDVKANTSSYTQKSVVGETMTLQDSTTTGATEKDFMLTGSLSTKATPTASPIDYTYGYDSVTGKFTESDSATTAANSVTITNATIQAAYTNEQYSQQITTTSTGATPTYTATGLPATLTIGAATGVIGGKPTAAGTYTVTVTATSGTVTDTKTYTLNIYTRPVVNSSSLSSGSLNTAYSRTISTSGNPAVTIFTLNSGSLPPGLNLNLTNGVVSGTPTATGTYTFTVTASSSIGDSAPKTITLAINSPAVITTTTLPNPTLNVPYSQTIATTGSPSPTFTSSGTLPTGLTFDAATGKISGTATGGAGSSQFNVTATNTAGSSYVSYAFVVEGNNIAAGSQTSATTMPATFTNVSTRLTGSWGIDTLVVDSNGNAYYTYFADSLLKVAPDGTKTTLAGGAGGGYRDGTGTSAGFYRITSAAIDSSDNIYVADWSSSTNQTAVRRITPAGVVTTLAIYTNANMTNPSIALGPDGSYYLGTAKANSPVSIIKINTTGGVSTVLDGSVVPVQVYDIWVSSSGVVYLTNINFDVNTSNLGYRVNSATSITAIGTGTYPAYKLTGDNNGNLYFGSGGDNSIYKYNIAGGTTTRYTSAATTGVDGTIGGAGTFKYPNEVFASNGKLYFLDSSGIRYLS